MSWLEDFKKRYATAGLSNVEWFSREDEKEVCLNARVYGVQQPVVAACDTPERAADIAEAMNFVMVASDWESMESAPKEGYLWLFGTVKTFDGYERQNAMVIGRWNDVVKEWRISGLGGPREVAIEPQLWQRVPKPPA